MNNSLPWLNALNSPFAFGEKDMAFAKQVKTTSVHIHWRREVDTCNGEAEIVNFQENMPGMAFLKVINLESET